MISFNSRSLWRLLLVCALFAPAGMAVSPSSAFAGTAGQQIALYAPADRSYQICGPNQTGAPKCYSHNVTFPATPVRDPSILIQKYWWAGTVKIYNYASTGERDLISTRTCTVPAVQTSSDWTECVEPTTRGYPDLHSFRNLGGKQYDLLSDNWAFDPSPRFHFYVPRDYTFGYWDGHYVYEINNHVGIDISNGDLVVAETTYHWFVFQGAVQGAAACSPGGGVVAETPIEKVAIADIEAWCGVVGATTRILGPAPTPTSTTTGPTPLPPGPAPTPAPTPSPSSPTSPLTSGNLLYNPGFEIEPGAPGWYRNNLARAVNEQVYDSPGRAHSGAWFFETNTSQAGGSIAQDVQQVPVAGNSYNASIWLRSPGGQPFSVCVVVWALGTTNVPGQTCTTVGGAWQQVSASLDPPQIAGAYSKLRVEVYENTPGLNLDLDDASLTRSLQ